MQSVLILVLTQSRVTGFSTGSKMFASSQIPSKPSETQVPVTWYTLALSSFMSTKPSMTSHHHFLPDINPAVPAFSLFLPHGCSQATETVSICLEAFSLWSLFGWLPLTIQALAQIRLLQWAFPGHPIYYYPYPIIPYVSTSVSSWHFLVSYCSLIYFHVYCLSPALDYKLKGPSS